MTDTMQVIDFGQFDQPYWNLPTYWPCAGCGCFVKIGDAHSCPMSLPQTFPYTGTSNWVSCPTCQTWHLGGTMCPTCFGPKVTPAATGWSCPRCTRVYAPHVGECAVCNGAVKETP